MAGSSKIAVRGGDLLAGAFNLMSSSTGRRRSAESFVAQFEIVTAPAINRRRGHARRQSLSTVRPPHSTRLRRRLRRLWRTTGGRSSSPAVAGARSCRNRRGSIPTTSPATVRSSFAGGAAFNVTSMLPHAALYTGDAGQSRCGLARVVAITRSHGRRFAVPLSGADRLAAVT